jgi:hypothetical protein
MSARVKEIVRRGKWVYGEEVISEVLIFRQNYFEGPRITDEEPTPGYPPRDQHGMFYYAAYAQRGVIRGVSNVCGSVNEATQLAEQTIQGPIVWERDEASR